MSSRAVHLNEEYIAKVDALISFYEQRGHSFDSPKHPGIKSRAALIKYLVDTAYETFAEFGEFENSQ